MSNDAMPPILPRGTGGAITVRGLAPELKARLRVRAAHSARSMEVEARAILEAALSAPAEDATDLAAFARGLFAPLGGVELELPSREPARDPPRFGDGQDGAAISAASPQSPPEPAASTRPATALPKKATNTQTGRKGRRG